MANRDKLISFPEEILETLYDYKIKTGIPVSSYIRECVARKMIVDGLIVIKVRCISSEEKKERKKKISMVEATESNKFCDGDSCGVDPRIKEK